MNSALSLNGYITPRLLKVVYWIGLVAIAFLTLVGIYNAITFTGDLNSTPQQTGFVSLLTVIVTAIAATILWRVAIELILVVFSIHDLLRDIRNQVGPAPVYNRRRTDPR